ncbi:MAG TPA: NUDIX hydrolase [candidate division Zixibacteria bacterium]|nr:NUDIX hydrolase [candidate division Zixibacteria bacterium]
MSQQVRAWIDRYGQPAEVAFRMPTLDEEFEMIRASQKQGRAHDVTLYIRKADRFIVNAKPFYPPGQYRAPSGGLEPSENLEDGVAREVAEETGTEVTLQRFLLISQVTFVRSEMPPVWEGSVVPFMVKPHDNGSWPEPSSNEEIPWVSYVFLADYVSGDFEFTDRREIKEVRLARLDEFDGFSKIMRQSQTGGLHYRAALHDTVAMLLGE